MNKFIVVIILLFSCIYVSGCSRDNHKAVWNMEYIQGKDGEVIYCSQENKDIYQKAEVKDITCILDKSSITITDKDTKEQWVGDYKVIDKDVESIVYEVIFNNNETGIIVKSITKYEDNIKQDTLIISSGGYSLNLSAK